MIPLKQIEIHHLSMRLISPFVTSFGSIVERELLLIEAVNREGMSGWGEVVAFDQPIYTEETVKTAYHIIRDFLLPLLWSRELTHPEELRERFAPIRRHPMAKAGIEMAIWDLYAKEKGLSLAKLIGAQREKIAAGVSVGLQKDTSALLETVAGYVQEGYQRVKVKIKPGEDIQLIEAIRRRYPRLPLMADANSAYTLHDAQRLSRLDDYHLLMIEQPLAYDDMVDHAALQKKIRTPICLDESILTAEDVRRAHQIGACRVVNVKIGRVGGIAEVLRIHRYATEHGISLWCGGMLESGVGRAHNIAIAALPGFDLPGDISASARYWEEDIVQPEVTVEQGMIRVPQAPGIGVEVDRARLEKYRLGHEVFTSTPA